MANFLINVNLPYYFSLWNNENYIHQNDINDEAKDSEIWNYAKERQLTIVSKDCDFSTRILLNEPPPKVILVKLGNLKMKQFYRLFLPVWKDVLELNKNHELVKIFHNRLEGIN